ncbi:MAG: prolipoprotein diacylglyceryl transferase, partial [Lachnospiraceae bacterium]
MSKSIIFPNIGIHLDHIGSSFTVFGFEIAYYGIVIGFGILCGIMIAVSEAKRTNQKVEDYYDLAIYGIVFSIIGARLYFVIFS